ncbi:prolyl oligopeptidase family serine peptidase, partial [Candidatus Woesebacteria bacterium]|nr:prolyl oligopeptidase family serine peptidase [Candidatus Woesebacteria bacterium]
LHQGGLDDAVPARWSDQLYDKLKEKDKEIEYFTYPEADHNMQPDWTTATIRSISFFDEKLR